MNSLVLRYSASILTPILLIFSLVLLFRGHDLPGGGFMGGLIASSAFILQALGFGIQKAKAWLRVEPHFLMGAGILVAVTSALVALSAGMPFMTGLWVKIPLGIGSLKVGTPVLFDIGVYLAVLGTNLTIFFHLKD